MEAGNLPKKFEKGFKFSYSKIKQCVMKKEAGIDDNECKKMFKEDLGIEWLDEKEN